MRSVFFIIAFLLVAGVSAHADYRITRDHGGYVEEYKTRYARLRDRGERVVIDGICNSACTLVLGIVPQNRICVTPRASLGFHQAYYDKAYTFGIKVTSSAGTTDLMSYYPKAVKDWLRANGGLTTEMKKIRNGTDLWKIVDPCPDEF
jgi:outer membrane scaffolding protein for murein synthesis (MipA/OmpV family)